MKSEEESWHSLHPHIRTFHARHGRLSERRKSILAHQVPHLEVRHLPTPLNIAEHLNRDYAIVDFGAGMGHHAISLSRQHPDWAVLAIDVHTPGICDISAAAHSDGHGNVLVHLGDGLDVLRDQLSAQSIHELHVLFPDPWPKARHNKRRVIQPSFLEIVNRILTDDGILRIVTDDDDYASHVDEVLCTSQVMQPVVSAFTVPETAYHKRALRLGHTIHVFAAGKRQHH